MQFIGEFLRQFSSRLLLRLKRQTGTTDVVA